MALFFHWEMKSMPGQIFSSEPLLRDPGLWLAWQEKPIPHFLHSTSPCSDSAQQIIVVQALMKSIIALVRYLMIFSSLVSVGHFLLYFFFLSHIIESNMSLVCECLQLWLHC